MSTARRLVRWMIGPMTQGARRSAVALFMLMVALAAVNLLFTVHYVKSSTAARQQQAAQQQAAQQAQAAATERKICTAFAALATLKPPSGSPANNPSRAYLQGQHAILVEIGVDVGCAGTKG